MIVTPVPREHPLTFHQAETELRKMLENENRSHHTLDGYIRWFQRFREFWAGQSGAEWDGELLLVPWDWNCGEDFLSALVAERRQGEPPGLSEDTVQTALNSLKGCYRRLEQARFIPQNPFDHLYRKRERGKPGTRRLTAPEVTELLVWAEGHPDLRAIVFVKLGLYGGLRFSEVQELTWHQALGGPDLHFKGKGDRWRHVPRTRPLTDSLQRLRAYSRRAGDQDRVLQGRGGRTSQSSLSGKTGSPPSSASSPTSGTTCSGTRSARISLTQESALFRWQDSSDIEP